jgi:hypothetical protein
MSVTAPEKAPLPDFGDPQRLQTPRARITGMSSQPSAPLFTPPSSDRSSIPAAAWFAAAFVVAGIVLALLLITHRTAANASNTPLPLDPYAAHLVFSNLVMSESTSLSGGKSTYIDGHVRNTGTRTVTGALLQVLFSLNAPTTTQREVQIESVPLTLIRTHEPYIDTEPLSAAPLAPGDDREFRLIFENIAADWNQQVPDINPVHITFK